MEEQVIRRYVKYVFLDVVQFSRRSAEAQTEIISRLNEIVRLSLEAHKISYDDDTILIPTGDGVCVGFVSHTLTYDIHIRVAHTILEDLFKHNETTKNDSRRFGVRIGLNQNTDILITDINGKNNIAGAGINLASRIMDKADGGQILVSQAVFHELQPSETYMDKFKLYMATGKHDMSFQVYQYLDAQRPGLNNGVPTAFATPAREKKRLAEEVAHYIAQSIVHREALVKVKANADPFWEDAAIVLLRFLSEDAYEASRASDFGDPPYVRTKGAGSMTFEQQYEYYTSQNTWLRGDAEAFIVHSSYFGSLNLSSYSDCFERDGPSTHYAFASKDGAMRVKEECGEVFAQYQLEQHM